MVESSSKQARSLNSSALLWGLLGVAIVGILLYVIFQSVGTIHYQGLTFTKEAYQDLVVYHYWYYFNDSRGQIYKNNIFLRTDPRENMIVTDEGIEYPSSKTIYVGINNSGLNTCEDSTLALGTLYSFFANNLYDVKTGTLSNDEAIAKQQRFINCTTNPGNMVILFQRSSETRVARVGKLCYEIRVNECESILPLVEKFIVQSLVDAKRDS